MNFDNRSIAFNNETSLVALDSVIGSRLDSVFIRDMEHSTDIKLADFQRRGWFGRTLEWGAEKLWRVL